MKLAGRLNDAVNGSDLRDVPLKFAQTISVGDGPNSRSLVPRSRHSVLSVAGHANRADTANVADKFVKQVATVGIPDLTQAQHGTNKEQNVSAVPATLQAEALPQNVLERFYRRNPSQ